MMLEFTPTLRALCGIMSVGGFEREAVREAGRLFGDAFDSFSVDAGRNGIFRKRSAKSGPHPTLLLDAHFDEVGMIVTDITDEGFLRVTGVGGIDCRLLPASRVRVYPKGRDPLPGVFLYLPPDLAKHGEKTPDNWNRLLVDIGASSKREAEEAGVETGTAVGYAETAETLLNGRIKGRAFDDKASAAVLLCAAANIPAEELAYDLVLVLSSGEEVGGGGARTAAWTADPDLALVCDVNFAVTPGVGGDEGGKMGEGPVISRSAVTDRSLTRALCRLAEAYRIPYSDTVEPTSTGTNASSVVYVREGIPTAVIGPPIGGMHSKAEVMDPADAESMIRLITLFLSGARPEDAPPAEDESSAEGEPPARDGQETEKEERHD